MNLKGGLGNQLFQFAAGYTLAKKNQDTIKIDLTSYTDLTSNNTPRKPDLLSFNTDVQIATTDEICRLRNPYGTVSIIQRYFNQKIKKKHYHDWHPEIMGMKGDIYLDGYFQSEKYFKDTYEQLRDKLTLKNELMANISKVYLMISEKNCPVSIHVRRGDYVNNPKIKKLHDICTPAYFKNAISYFQKNYEDVDFFVFSDDIDWVKKNLDWPTNSIFVSGMHGMDGSVLSASEELLLMSCCNHNVISNSTFSWWGAYLNSYKNKKVIAPTVWNKSVVFRHVNIIPDTWTRLPC